MKQVSDYWNANKDSISNIVDQAGELSNQYLVTPLADLGIAGFRFDIEDTTSIDLDCDITDHYTEDNTPIQDVIAIKPDRITLRGFVGELVYRKVENNNELEKLAEKLVTITSFLPAISTIASETQNIIKANSANKIDYLSNVFDSSVNIYKAFKTINTPDTKQAQAFNYFRALRNARVKFSIDTPYSFYTNMVIEKINATLDGQTRNITEFTVTFKQINTAKTSTVKFDPKKFQSRTLNQRSPTQDIGRVAGEPVSDNSIIFNIFN